MNRKFLIISGIILLLAATAGIFYWCSDRRKLNVMLDDAEHLVSKRPATAPHDGVLKYAAVDRIFAEKLTVSCDAPALNMRQKNGMDSQRTHSIFCFVKLQKPRRLQSLSCSSPHG